MTHSDTASVRRWPLALAACYCALAVGSIRADEPSAPAAAPASAVAPAAHATRTQNVTINLINRLVERGVLTAKDAHELIQMAEEDAVQAKAEAAATQAALARLQAAPPQPPAAPIPAPVATAVATAAAPDRPAEGEGNDDTIRVTYIPPAVKRQIIDEMKQDVMDTAYVEHWGAASAPEWTQRIKLFGDVRFRYEGLYYPHGNENTGAFPNFNAINTGAPLDVTGAVFSPQLNVDQNRDRLRLRARGGLAADLGEGFTAALRAGTGENNSPVTENQSLGAANNAQGGNFSKYSIWLDRAYIKYERGSWPDQHVALTLGRFDNPFFATSMIWADDLGFDGAVFEARRAMFDTKFRPFVTVGAFPVFNTDLNFATNQPSKFRSEDKWLAAAQTGAVWTPVDDFSVKFGAAYYDFQNIAGKLSAPFVPVTSSDQGNTDTTRPAFAQKGNTYMALRDITPSPLNNNGGSNQWQYFGLATPFRDLAFTGQVDFGQMDPVHVTLSGEYVHNLAFDAKAIAAKAVNNLGATTSSGATPFVGGGTGWTASLKIGTPALEKRWDWNVSFGYRYLESDAVVDGFNDSDFGGGGTNLKGFMTSANLSLSARVWVGVRWLSANSIAGPTFKADTLQIDTNAKF